jgi:ZIP family zinc transporter
VVTTALWASGATCVVTLGGGIIALRLRAHRGVVYAFSAGALVATALMEVVPSALTSLDASIPALMPEHLLVACTLGFLCFYLLEQATHGGAVDDDAAHHAHTHPACLWGAAGIGVHSFLDGFAIGQAFQAGGEVGGAIGLGVLLHKVADGVSAVGIMLGSQHTLATTRGVLLAIAAAPIVGVLAQQVVGLSPLFFSLMLGWFAGVFLYLGATSLLPTAHEVSRSRWLPLATVAGAAMIYLAHWLAQ